MPIPGLCNPEGAEVELAALSEYFQQRGAGRFVLYLRTARLNGAYAKLATRLANIAGIKVGTDPRRRGGAASCSAALQEGALGEWATG